MQEFKLLRKLSMSSRMISYLVSDNSGQLHIASWLDKERLLMRYEMVIHDQDEDLSLDEVKLQAQQKLDALSTQWQSIYDRTADLYHPNVSEIHDMIYDKERDAHILLTDYVPGRNMIEATKGLTPLQMIPLFVKAFEALDFVHANGFLHLNIKSNTFWVNLDVPEPVIKMMNYGFALPLGDFQESFRGTAVYMAPEVALGQTSDVDERADLYSMGTLMYYCIKRSLPFEARKGTQKNIHSLLKRIEKESVPSGLHQFNSDTPKELETLILCLLEKKPENRVYTNAAQILNHFIEIWPDASQEIAAEQTITIVNHDV